jgi:hypothetical protein
MSLFEISRDNIVSVSGVVAIIFVLIGLPLLLTPSIAFSGVASTSPPPTHEISGSCQNGSQNCGTVICGSHNGGRAQAGITFDVLYNKLQTSGIAEIFDFTHFSPNPALFMSVLSLSKSGNNFTLKGIIENIPQVTACGYTLPPLPATYTLSGICGYGTIATLKSSDGIRGSFKVNVACA